jgi:hypothetical protein
VNTPTIRPHRAREPDAVERFRAAFDRTAAGRRENVPPVLVFRKPESGVVEFCGLCVPDHFEVRSYQDGTGTQIPNFLFHFSILNTQSVPVQWLHDRAQTNDDSRAPDVWSDWIETGTVAQWPAGEPLDRSGRVRRYDTTDTVVSDQFRSDVFDRYGHACAMTDIQVEDLLDLAHILPRSNHPDLAEHPENVLVLNSLHHRAFDAALFTIDSDYRIRTSPSFDPAHPFLRETIADRAGQQIEFPADVRIRPDFLQDLNTGLSWL